MRFVFFSSVSGNTKKLIERVGIPAQQIPLYPQEPPLQVVEEYVLVTPTYGSGTVRGAVPKQVIKFLNDETNRKLCRGVITTGNTNFGEGYGLAGNIISEKVGVPLLYKVEVFGTPDDIERIKEGMEKFWLSL